MPIFVFDCEVCDEEIEVILPLSRRDEVRLHCGVVEESDCLGTLKRQPVARISIGKPSYQCGAILSSGETVPGNFGKDAPKKKGWRRP